jgi:mannose-6-phosphate isomerase-like protein (cupin superfamily)
MSIIDGTAKFRINKDVQLVTESKSVYSLLYAAHRIDNLGLQSLVLIDIWVRIHLTGHVVVGYEGLYLR